MSVVQLTWISSIANRVTGSALSVGTRSLNLLLPFCSLRHATRLNLFLSPFCVMQDCTVSPSRTSVSHPSASPWTRTLSSTSTLPSPNGSRYVLLVFLVSATAILTMGYRRWTLQYSAKGLVALPFTFHTFNGLRHLSWDMGYCQLPFLPSFLPWLPLSILTFMRM